MGTEDSIINFMQSLSSHLKAKNRSFKFNSVFARWWCVGVGVCGCVWVCVGVCVGVGVCVCVCVFVCVCLVGVVLLG